MLEKLSNGRIKPIMDEFPCLQDSQMVSIEDLVFEKKFSGLMTNLIKTTKNALL